MEVEKLEEDELSIGLLKFCSDYIHIDCDSLYVIGNSPKKL